jgi:hypothetical protein
MKINYSTQKRIQQDYVEVVLDISEEAEPVTERRVSYQPTSLTLKRQRQRIKPSLELAVDLGRGEEWRERWIITGFRILKSGALGSQSRPMGAWMFDEDRLPWLTDALKLAREELDKIISEWPDPSWL